MTTLTMWKAGWFIRMAWFLLTDFLLCIASSLSGSIMLQIRSVEYMYCTCIVSVWLFGFIRASHSLLPSLHFSFPPSLPPFLPPSLPLPQINLRKVYYAFASQSSFSQGNRLFLLLIAAHTRQGQLCVEVWVSSSEDSSNYIEVIDVLAKVNSLLYSCIHLHVHVHVP